MLTRTAKITLSLAHVFAEHGFSTLIVAQPSPTLAVVAHGPDLLLTLAPTEPGGDRVTAYSIQPNAAHPKHDEAIALLHATITSPEWIAQYGEPIAFPVETADA